MEKKPKNVRAYWGLGLAHVVCCGGIILVATGAVSGLGGWLLDDGAIWLALGLGAVIAGLLVRRRRTVYEGTRETREGTLRD